MTISPSRRRCLFCDREALTAASVCAVHLDDPRGHREAAFASLAVHSPHFRNFAGVAWPAADLRGLVLEHVGFEDANLRDARFDGADLARANFQRARLARASLAGCPLQVANFQDADLRGADLRGARLEGCQFSGADLRGADLTGATMTGTQCRHADLRGASLAGARLLRTSFSSSKLTGLDLRGARLRECSALDAEGLEEVLRDAATEGFDGLRPKEGPPRPDASGRPLPPKPSSFVWRKAPDLPES